MFRKKQIHQSYEAILFLLFIVFCSTNLFAGSIDSALYLKKTISGKISPKSVVHNGQGTFYAQNMMYRHTVTVYDRSYTKVATIKDGLNPADFGFSRFDFKIKGGPVECAFSHNGKYAWVSNYSISGGDSTQFVHPGCDNCSGTGKYDSSFLYKVEVASNKIVDVVQVGAVPKYVAVSPDNKWVLVTNWSSGDLSIVDVAESKEVKRIKLGTFPRGIVVDPFSQYAYATVMGSKKLARINLSDFTVNFINDVGKGPRHLCISPDGQWLYLTLNSENKIAKINLQSWEVKKLKVGHQPRSMTISGDGKSLYIVNYNDNTFSKVNTAKFEIEAVSKTKTHPIGITYDDKLKEVWVACYSGYLQVFKDSLIKRETELPVSGDVESDLLSVDFEDEAAVAQINPTPEQSVQQDSIDQDVNEVAKVVSREMLPIRRSYFDYKKIFDFKKSKTIAEDKIVKAKDEIVKPTIVNNKGEVELNQNASFLVIVGSFGEPDNADTMIGMMKKEGLSAASFKHSSKNLTYVFVYSSASLEETQQWCKAEMPSDIEYWIKKQ